MNRRFTLELLAVALLTAAITFLETVFLGGDCYIDDGVFLDASFGHAAPTIDCPNDHVTNSPEAGKEH